MKNKDLTTVFVILTKDYNNESGVRVVQVVDSRKKALRFCDGSLGKYYWYEEVSVD